MSAPGSRVCKLANHAERWCLVILSIEVQAQKTLNNIEEGYYISPAFLDKMTIHIAKNFLDLPKIKVPLILGEFPS